MHGGQYLLGPPLATRFVPVAYVGSPVPSSKPLRGDAEDGVGGGEVDDGDAVGEQDT